MTMESPQFPSGSSALAAGGVAQLADCLAQQRELYQQLKALSDQQAGLIADGATEQLLTVLSRRQALVEQLGQLNRTAAPIRDRWPQIAPTLAASERARVDRLLGEVETLLASIIAQDDRDRQQLQSAKQKVGGELRQVSNVGRAVNAYKAVPAPGAATRFTDRQG